MHALATTLASPEVRVLNSTLNTDQQIVAYVV